MGLTLLSGVQLGTAFVTTAECDASETFKNVYIMQKPKKEVCK